jgi:hypothetical protein
MGAGAKIEEIVADVLRRRAAGEAVSDEQVYAAYPDLKPQLEPELSKLRRIRQAFCAAREADSELAAADRAADDEPTAVVLPPGLSPAIPDYELSHAIGSGGFGEVWLARNRHTGQLYAVKVFPATQSIELDGVREYKKRSQGHPNLVPIEHVGRTLDGRHVYYVMPPADEAKGTAPGWEMEDYEPVTLQRLLRYGQAPLPLDQVLAIADQLLAALAHLHQAGLIHKDVKPANVLRVKGVWLLGDMGLLAHSDKNSIDAGTPGFRPPEGPVDRTADLYALGKTIFLLATGADLSHFEDLAAGRLAMPAADTRSEPLRALLLKACAENPHQRYRTAAEMQQAVAELRRPQPAGRGWARWGIGAAAVLLLAAPASYYLFLKPPPVGEPRTPLLPAKPALDVRVASLDVELLQGKPPVRQGMIGRDCWATRFKDAVQATARLSEPAHGYLLTFAPNGSDFRLLASSKPDDPPEQSAEVKGRWRLDEGLGLQVFVVVVSRDSLPSYAEWKKRHPGLVWRPTEAAGVWSYDNGEVERLDKVRSPVDEAELAVGPKPFVELCDWLRGRPGIASVRALAFPVRPDPRVVGVSAVALGFQPLGPRILPTAAALLGGNFVQRQQTQDGPNQR